MDLSDVAFVKTISIGNIDGNNPNSDKENEEQVSLLNRMLTNMPKGKIIGKDVRLAVKQVGDEQVTLIKTIYHVGFNRKPVWID
jgi:hypothetical protein